MFESNIPRYASLIRRLFSIKGNVPLGVDSLGVPTFPLLEGPPDLAFLRQELIANGQVAVAAVLGEFSFVRLIGNNRDTLYTIHRVLVRSSLVTGIRWAMQTAAAGSSVVGTFGVRDSRWQPQLPAFSILAGTNAALLLTTDYARVTIGPNNGVEAQTLQGPWVISNQIPLEFWLDAVNAQLDLTVFWSERAMEVGER